MSSGGLSTLVAGVVIAMALGIVLGGGLARGSVEVPQSSFRTPDPPSDITQRVVTELRSEGGNSLFGWQFDKPEVAVNVWVIALAGVVASGPIVGSCQTPEGNGLYLVRVLVSDACYEMIEAGAPWPPVRSNHSGYAGESSTGSRPQTSWHGASLGLAENKREPISLSEGIAPVFQRCDSSCAYRVTVRRGAAANPR